VRPGPLPSHQLPVPAEEGLWSDQERVPCSPPKDPARCGEECPVGCAVDRALHLAAEDRDLVAQHGDFKLRLGRSALVGPEQAEDAAQEKVEDGPDHGAALSQIAPPPQTQVAIEFLDLTVLDPGSTRDRGPPAASLRSVARCDRWPLDVTVGLWGPIRGERTVKIHPIEAHRGVIATTGVLTR
jgi:hypothetical protein